MSDDVRCLRCDLPLPTAEQWETMRGGDGVGLCWADGAAMCRGARIDWRGRALAAEALLGAAARGELPRCVTCGDRLATRHWPDTVDDVCDVCFAEEVAEAREDGATLDEAACADLPHAAALRAAMARGGAT